MKNRKTYVIIILSLEKWRAMMFTRNFPKTEEPYTKTNEVLTDSMEGATQPLEKFEQATAFALEQVPFGVCVIDEKNVIKYANRMMKQFFNIYYKGEMVGRQIDSVSPKVLRRFLSNKILELNAGKIHNDEKVTISTSSGEIRTYHFWIHPVTRNGQKNGCIFVCKNVSLPVSINLENKSIVDARDIYDAYFNSQHSILVAISATEKFKILHVSNNKVDEAGNDSLKYVQKVASKANGFTELIYKNDVKRYINEMDSVVKFGSKLAYIYFRFIDDSGMIKWAKQTTIPKLGDTGSIEYLICIIEDASLKCSILNDAYTGENFKINDVELNASDELIEKHIDRTVLCKILDENVTNGIVHDYNDAIKIGEIDSKGFVVSDSGKLTIVNDSQIKRLNIDVLRFSKATKNFYQKFVDNNNYECSFCDADGKDVRLIAFGVNKTLISIYFVKPLDDVFCNVDWVCKYLKITLKNILKICVKNISTLNQIDEFKEQREQFIDAINIQKSIPSLINIFYSSNNYYTGFKNVLSKICEMLKLDRIHVYSYAESSGRITNYMNYFVNNDYTVDAKELRNVLNASFMDLFSATGIIHVSNYANVSNALKEYANASKAVSSIMYAIKVEGAVRFFVIFDDMNNNREWQSQVLLLIENICSVLSTLILNEKTMSNMVQTQHTLEKVLNEMNSSIYVIEDGTREILYLNKMSHKVFKDASVQKHCDECLCTDMCLTDCPLAQLAGVDGEESISFEYFNSEKQAWYIVNASRVKWEGIKRAILITLTDTTESIKSKQKDEDMYYKDYITGFYNDLRYQKFGNSFLESATKANKKVAHITIKAPELKEIAEEYGYKSVTEILVRISKILNQSGSLEEMFVAKVVDDNFVVMLPFTNEQSMFEYVRQIASSLDKIVLTEDMQRQVRVVLGISFFPEHGNDIETLYKKSWLAIQMAIAQKGINYKFYDKLVQTTIEKEEEFKKEVLNAFKNRQFCLYFQPKLNLKTNRIDSAEALIRWKHPELGLLSAGEFVDILEETDRDDKFGLYIMEESIKALKMFNSLPNCENIKISFNALGKTFFRYDFFQRVLRLVESYKVKPSNLEIELTEKMLLKSTKHSQYIIAQFRQYGVKLSIDDFGTGYSSLSYLKNLNVDVLKIDKIFLNGIFNDEKSKSIAISIINLAKMLGYQVLFEGIETEAEMNFVKENGCDYVQGFYVGTALSREEFLKAILNQDKTERKRIKKLNEEKSVTIESTLKTENELKLENVDKQSDTLDSDGTIKTVDVKTSAENETVEINQDSTIEEKVEQVQSESVMEEVLTEEKTYEKEQTDDENSPCDDMENTKKQQNKETVNKKNSKKEQND